MNFELRKNERLSGTEASVYEVFLEGEASSVFEQFLTKYKGTHRTQLKNILDRLETIGHDYGARSDFFKEHEGKYGDLVEALFDTPGKALRLYCIRFGGDCIILGGGAPKPKNIKAWQDDEELTTQAELVIQAAKQIHRAYDEKEWKWSGDFKNMTGNLEFKDEDES